MIKLSTDCEEFEAGLDVRMTAWRGASELCAVKYLIMGITREMGPIYTVDQPKPKVKKGFAGTIIFLEKPKINTITSTPIIPLLDIRILMDHPDGSGLYSRKYMGLELIDGGAEDVRDIKPDEPYAFIMRGMESWKKEE